MRHLVLALGASAVLALCVAEACSNNTDVVNGGGGSTATTTSSHGGTGTTTSTTHHGGTGGTGGSSCVGGGPCEQACCKISEECGFQITCAQIPTTIINLDCVNGQPQADCNGACIVATSCEDLQTIATGTPPPALQACLQDCGTGGGGGGNPCLTCAYSSCSSQALACAQAQGCQPYLNCVTQCAAGDAACLAGCLTDHPSSEATALATCICGSCSADCPCSGAGGAGGNFFDAGIN